MDFSDLGDVLTARALSQRYADIGGKVSSVAYYTFAPFVLYVGLNYSCVRGGAPSIFSCLLFLFFFNFFFFLYFFFFFFFFFFLDFAHS
jgi:hypothetical protein